MNTKYTKQSLEAMLTLMVNLSGEAVKIGRNIAKGLAAGNDSGLYELLTGILDGSRTDVGEIMADLEKDGYLANVDDGPECIPTKVTVGNAPYDVRVSRPLVNGRIVAYVYEPECTIPAAGLMYESDWYAMDIAYAEQKRGTLALLDDKPEDNEDIDVYLYADASVEGWTSKFTLKKEEIDKVLG